MTTLLKQAFAQAEMLSADEQNVLASRLLAELAAEDDFDCAIAGSAEKLSVLAQEAIDEHCSGESKEFDPERL